MFKDQKIVMKKLDASDAPAESSGQSDRPIS